MKLNIPHKRNTAKAWKRAQRDFLGRCRPLQSYDSADVLATGEVGKHESIRIIQIDWFKFKDKRQRRRLRRRDLP